MKTSHRTSPLFAPTVSLLATAMLLIASGRATAQPVIVGRILIGGPSDAEVDTGFGYYPSGHGFVNGYGYYPDYYYVNSPQIAINYYKWKGAPPAPRSRRRPSLTRTLVCLWPRQCCACAYRQTQTFGCPTAQRPARRAAPLRDAAAGRRPQPGL